MNFYAQELVDYYKNPKNKGALENPTCVTEEYNPSCGDKVQFFIDIQDNCVQKMTFLGAGCVISQATASMLTEFVQHKDISTLLALQAKDILDIIKIELGPTRLRCALLSLHALQKGLRDYIARKGISA